MQVWGHRKQSSTMWRISAKIQERIFTFLRFAGVETITPFFKDSLHPETVLVTRKLTTIRDNEALEMKGDWFFAFSLQRLEGNLELLNETIQNEDTIFTLQSIEYTPVSTIISYEQVVTDEGER